MRALKTLQIGPKRNWRMIDVENLHLSGFRAQINLSCSYIKGAIEKKTRIISNIEDVICLRISPELQRDFCFKGFNDDKLDKEYLFDEIINIDYNKWFDLELIEHFGPELHALSLFCEDDIYEILVKNTIRIEFNEVE